MHRTAIATCALSALTLLSGCATPPPPAPVGVDPARAALELALARQADLPSHAVSADAPAAPAAIGNTVTIRGYAGEAASLLARVAKARGMAFKVTGPQPHLPLLVTVDAKEQDFVDFLRDLSLQFGQRASLVLGQAHIEIRYGDHN